MDEQPYQENEERDKDVQEAFAIPQFKELVPSKNDSLTSVDIQEMERVRLSLQGMLKSSEHFLHDDKAIPGGSQQQGFPLVQSSGVDSESFTSIGTSDLLNNFVKADKQEVVDMTDLTTLGGSSGDSTRRLRHKYDKSLLVENSLLNDSLEKERLKRKHCEQQIKELQTKLLETMQELAVSVSGERKKDVMINQLDKTLARVVDDWKKHEQEKLDAFNKLEERREQDEQSQQRQQEMLGQFEKDLSQAVEALSKEQERAAMVEQTKDSQINEISQDREQLLALLEEESQNNTLLKKNLEELQDKIKRDEECVSILNQERHSWQNERSDLEAKVELITKAHTEDLENERKLVEHEKQVAEDSQRVLDAVQKEVQLLTVQLDTSNRERENLKTEITLLTAKFEAQKTRQDGEYQAELEKQAVSLLMTIILPLMKNLEKHLQEAQNQLRKNEHELRVAHKKQIEELTQRYKNDLENQLRNFHEQLKERDVNERKLMQINDECEERLSNARAHMVTISTERETLKNEKLKMVVRLQNMMRSHCEEALSLLTIDPVDQGGVTAHRSNNTIWQTPAPVTRASFVGISRDPPHDSASFTDHNRGLLQQVNPTWEDVHPHTRNGEESGQQWVRLSPMTAPQVDHMTRENNHKTKQSHTYHNGPQETIISSDHSTSGDENKLDYPSRSTVTNVDENRRETGEHADVSPSTTNESYEEHPLEEENESEMPSLPLNLSTDVLKMLQQQNARQTELNHYVRQLLKQSPSSTTSGELANIAAINVGSTSPVDNRSDYPVISPVRKQVSEKDTEAKDKSNKQFSSDHPQSTSTTSEHNKQMAFRKSAATPFKSQRSSRIPVAHTPPNKDKPHEKGNAVLTPEQVGQLTRLIHMYQKDNGGDDLPSPQKMFQYLRDVQSRSDTGTEDKRRVGQHHVLSTKNIHGHPSHNISQSEQTTKHSKVKRKLEVNIPPNRPKDSRLSGGLTDDDVKDATRKSFSHEEPRKPSRAPLTSDSELSLLRRPENKSTKTRNSLVKPQKRSSGKAWK